MKKTNEIKGKNIINIMCMLIVIHFGVTTISIVFAYDIIYILNALLFLIITAMALIAFVKVNGLTNKR